MEHNFHKKKNTKNQTALGWQDFAINQKFSVCFAKVYIYVSNYISNNISPDKCESICDECLLCLLMMNRENFKQWLSLKIKSKGHRLSSPWEDRVSFTPVPSSFLPSHWLAVVQPCVGGKKRGCVISSLEYDSMGDGWSSRHQGLQQEEETPLRNASICRVPIKS